MPLGKFTNEHWLEIVQEFEEVVRAEPFQIPSAFIFLGRTLGTLFGICVYLQPDTPFFSLLEPHLRRLALSDDTGGGVWEQYKKQAVALAGARWRFRSSPTDFKPGGTREFASKDG